MDAFVQQKTWKVVPLPVNKNLVAWKWIYKIKKNPDGLLGTKLVQQLKVILKKLGWIIMKHLVLLLNKQLSG